MARYVQRKGAKGPRKSVLLIVLNILIGIELAGILLILLTFRGRNNNTYYNRKFDDQYSYYSIERGDYAELVNDYYNDWGILGRIKSGSEEAAALADYADAAFYKKAYDKTAAEDGAAQDAAAAERAQKFAERMEKDREIMGIYLPEADKIDQKLR